MPHDRNGTVLKVGDRVDVPDERVSTLSNEWVETSGKLYEQKQVAAMLKEDLDTQKKALLELTNNFTQVSATLARTETTPVITSINEGEEYCNVSAETEEKMFPGDCKSTLTLNAKQVILRAAAAIALLLSLGFAGCGTLDKSGVYGGDKALYDADLGIATSYEVLHSFVKYEYDNRSLLGDRPEVTKYADEVRKGAPQWFASALALRDAYAANPGSQTRSALQQSLDVLREATVQATRYLAATQPAK